MIGVAAHGARFFLRAVDGLHLMNLFQRQFFQAVQAARLQVMRPCPLVNLPRLGGLGIHPISSSGGVTALFRENISAGLSSSVLVANPVPLKDEIPAQEIESIIYASCKTAATQNITGKDLTPFLLGDILDKTSGRSLETNQALAINNIKLGIGVAKELAQSGEVLA